MKINFKFIVGLLVSLLIGVFLGFYFTYVSISKANILSRINADLYSLSYTLDALESLENHNGSNTSILREKLEISLISNLLIVMKVKPQLSDLQGEPLSALCKAVTYTKKQKGLSVTSKGEDKPNLIAKLADDYLKSIEVELKQYTKPLILRRHCNY